MNESQSPRRSAALANRAKKRRQAEKRSSVAAPTAEAQTPGLGEPLASIWLVAPLVFTSGAAALVFQVAWMRELRLIFGATTAAVAAVLAIFMAGLGLGSALLGKRIDRAPAPLRVYGLLEIAIALSAAVTPWLIDFIRAIYIHLGGQESLGLAGATIVRIALTAAVIGVPACLMGGTLPAAVRAVTSSDDKSRGSLGVLYGSNTLGAVFGSVVSTFFALESLGTRATLWAGCAAGLGAGALALSLARRLAPQESDAAGMLTGGSLKLTSTNFLRNEAALTNTVNPRIIYPIAGILGFAFFALELVWYRMLGPILGGTTFTFGLILCTALFGIGVGGLVYDFVFRLLRPTWSALAITCGCEALFTIAPYILGDQLALQAGWHAQQATSFSALVVGWTYITAIVVLPVALVSGLQFPLLIALLGEGRAGISRQLGMTYAWNTLGAIAGSLIAGFGGLPLLTAPGMWLAIALLLAGLSVLILVASSSFNQLTVAVVAGCALVTVCSFFARGPTAAWRHSGIGAGRAYLPPRTLPNEVQRWQNQYEHITLWEADGIESSVGIVAGDGLSFIVNGKNDGNSLVDSATQIGMPILGAVLHKDPKTALVIGLGTGESAGWLARFRNMEHVDVVELEPAIDEVAKRCRDVNHDVLNNPRVRRVYADGREFLLTTNNTYDLILSEPSNPYRAGIATLYTTEFYQAVKNRLNPGGLLVQWLQAYETSDATLGTVVSTVGSRFAHVELWSSLPLDLQLVCSDEPINYTSDELKQRIETHEIRDAMAKCWFVDDVEGLLTHFVANADWTKELTEAQVFPLNTDDRTVVEYGFAKSVGQNATFLLEDTRNLVHDRGFHRPKLSDNSLDWNRIELRRQVFNAILGGQPSIKLLPDKRDQELVVAVSACLSDEYGPALDHWPKEYLQPSDPIVRLLLAKCYAGLGKPEFDGIYAKVAEATPAEAAAVKTTYHDRRGEWHDAAKSLIELLSLLEKNPWVIPGVVEGAIAQADKIAEAEPSVAPQLLEHLSRRLAAHRKEFQRQSVRIFVAGQLGPERVVEALEPFEPNVPWEPKTLELRAKSYAAVGHPLKFEAEQDWLKYQRQLPVADRK